MVIYIYIHIHTYTFFNIIMINKVHPRILSFSSFYHIHKWSLGLMLLKYKFNRVHLDAPKNESIWKRSPYFENKMKMQFPARLATCQDHIGWDTLECHVGTTLRHGWSWNEVPSMVHDSGCLLGALIRVGVIGIFKQIPSDCVTRQFGATPYTANHYTETYRSLKE